MAGKSEMARRYCEALLDAGKTVAVMGLDHSTLHRRVKRGGLTLDVLTPLDNGVRGTDPTFVSFDELGKFGVPDIKD